MATKYPDTVHVALGLQARAHPTPPPVRIALLPSHPVQTGVRGAICPPSDDMPLLIAADRLGSGS